MNGQNANSSTPSQLWKFRFGTAEFDESRFELRVAGLQVDVQRKPLEILSLLLTHAGEVVTKDELLCSVWEGRPTVENVVANAMTKLRNALGAENANRIATQPRVGYRLIGVVERTAVGRALSSRMELRPEDPVPFRPNFKLVSLLGSSQYNEVWMARHLKTNEARVYKFAASSERLGALKRETTLSRLIREILGERDDFVRVLDWNFESPPFFLECEFGGEPLSNWARNGDRLMRMTVDRRIDLFLQIAQTVMAAHDVGVLHKDLKPSNILVAPDDETPGDNRWRIRLTDFGSGKLLDPEKLSELGITRLGMTLTTALGDSGASGTLLYLAPELIARQTPTVKSDIYALGIMLFQIVVGDLQRPMVSGWQRQIDNELLREDIAAATDGDPHHRLNSVAELIERLRHLEERNVQRQRQRSDERESTAIAEAVKRSRMRRPWIAATIISLVLTIAVGLTAYYRLSRSQAALTQQNEIAEHLNTFLTRDLIGSANPLGGGRSGVTVIEAARAAAKRIDPEFGSSNVEVAAALHEAMLNTFDGLSERGDAIAEARKALIAYQRAKPEDLRKSGQIKLLLANNLMLGASVDEAGRVLADLEKESTGTDRIDLLARCRIAQARLYILRLQTAESSKALAAARQTVAQHPELSTLNDDIDDVQARIYRIAGDTKNAERVLRDLVTRLTARTGAKSLETNSAALELAFTLLYDGRADAAEPIVRNVIDNMSATYSPQNHKVLYARAALAEVQSDRNDLAASAATWEELVRIVRSQGPTERDVLLGYEGNWANILQRMGNFSAAEAAYRDALAIGASYLPESDTMLSALRYKLAGCLLQLRRPAEAGKLLDGLSADTIKRAVQVRNPEGWLSYLRGVVAQQSGDPDTALAEFEKAQQAITDPTAAAGTNGLAQRLQRGMVDAKAARRER